MEDTLRATYACSRKKTIDVLKVVIKSELIPLPQNILTYYDMYYSVPDLCYSSTTIKEFLDLEYEQFLSAINFLYPEAEFSTEHGICVRTTSEYTLEPEIVKTGNNYNVLLKKYGDVFGWKEMNSGQMKKAWRETKASDMLIICKDIASGKLPELQMLNIYL